MNNNQWFDEHIKEQFSNYAPDVHPRIWKNIVAEKEKRKPVGFWFNFLNSRNILLILGILLAGGTGAWLVINISSAPVKNTTTVRMITEKNRLPDTKDPALAENNNPVVDNNAAAEKGSSPTLITLNNLNANDPATNFNKTSASGVTNIRISSPQLQSDIYDRTALNNNKKLYPNKQLFNNTSGLQEENLNNDNLPVQVSLFSRLIFGRQKIMATRKSNEVLIKQKLPFGYLPDCPAFEKNAAGNKKYFEIYAGPDFALRTMSDTGNSAYLKKRKESSNVSSAYSAGIRFTRVFNNSMSIRAGVNYSQINEKFTYVKGNLVQITYIIDANGDTTGSYITRGTRYKTTHNKYRSIDIPLLLGYELGNGRLHANINVGPVVNLYSWQKGEVLDTAYLPVSITTGKGNSAYQFKTNAGVGLMGAISVYYKLNDKLHIMAEPYFRYNLTPLNKDNLTLKQKYNTVGLKIGVRIDLK